MSLLFIFHLKPHLAKFRFSSYGWAKMPSAYQVASFFNVQRVKKEEEELDYFLLVDKYQSFPQVDTTAFSGCDQPCPKYLK